MQSSGQASITYFTGRPTGKVKTRHHSVEKASRLTIDDLAPFGSLNAYGLLSGFTEIADTKDYDAVLLLTDQGEYGLNNNRKAIPLQAPLYMFHVDKYAPAYDDNVLDLIYRTGGGVTTSVADFQNQVRHNSKTSRIIGAVSYTHLTLPTILLV